MKRYFTSNALNFIFIVNIFVYLIWCVVDIIPNSDISIYFIVLLSLNKLVLLQWVCLYQFVTYGFLHLEISHIFGNLFILLLFYPLISKIKNIHIMRVYIISVIMGGVICLLYNYLFDSVNFYIIGASGGILGLISYACSKFSDEYLFGERFKIQFKHILIGYTLGTIINLLGVDNFYGELGHLTGLTIGFLYYKIYDSNKILE